MTTDDREGKPFPDITPTSVVRSKFHVIENGDIDSDEELNRLMGLMYECPEHSFYLFAEKGIGCNDRIVAAERLGLLRFIAEDFFYYRHPQFAGDYVNIPSDRMQSDSERDVAKGPMFIRITLGLTKKGERQLEQVIKEGNPTAFWTRLRRRKVVQWGLVYAAAAWGFLQGLEYVGEAFHWPEQLRQIALIALLIGLPVVLVLAWYHGDRGQQRVSTPEFAILTLLLLLGGGAFWYYDRTSETATVASPPPLATAAIATDRSIAVLPFVNMSADKEQEYFADGISEELLNLLAQVPELRVIARTSSFSFKGKEVDIAEIARALNVANVLEGSVRKSGDKVRITAQLVRASDSSHLWSETYDRELTDVFRVQDDIASAVVSELKVALLGAPLKARESDPRSYVLFLQARDLARQGTSDSQKQAIDLYQQAVNVDPTHVAAWVGLANTHWLEVYGSGRTPDEGIPLAREAIQKALALDSGYAPAHALLGAIAITYDLDYSAAVQHIDRALALAPSNPDVIGIAGLLARRLGRHDQAIALFEYQVAHDPLNWAGHDDLAYANLYAGHLDKAIAELRMVLSLSPSSNGPHSQIAEVLLQKGDIDAAIAELMLEPDEQYRLPVLSMARHAQGMEPDSDAALAELIRKYNRTSAFAIAMVFAYRSATDHAFEWLDKAVQQHDLTLGSIAAYPMFATLHSDPRWLPFLRKLGMAPEQLAAIKFDVKVPR